MRMILRLLLRKANNKNMNTKFEFTGETKVEWGLTLKRIKAVKSFGNVSKGELGGWIEKESNLDVSGNAWVSGDARVYGNAWVYGDARVYGDAQVYGKLKLMAGFFFGVKWKSDTEIKQIEISNGDYLVYKGDALFGEEEPEVTEMTMDEVCIALGKTIKIKK